MGMAKKHKEILEIGDIENRYIAARNMVLVSAEFQIAEGVPRKHVYGELIDIYAKKYNLRKRKLGYMVAKPNSVY